MDPPAKKVRLTDHFRVALRPRDINQTQLDHKQQVTTLAKDVATNPNRDIRKSNASNGNNNTNNNNNNNTNKNNNNHTSIRNYLVKFVPPVLNQIHDFDRTQLNNVFFEPFYAADSFEYDRIREIKFRSFWPDWADNRMSQSRREELVDWLVDTQVRFDLDHEPLYMAVKLVDQYLMKKQPAEEDYELLFMVSMLIAAKFDERIPPFTIARLIQTTYSRFGIRYTRKQVVSFEVDLLTTLQFDIRFPLSYGFLRRFARCTRSDTQTLYLARYILESSLMDQEMIEVIESKLAAGSLLLAFNMLHKSGAWDDTARFYTGYNEKELNTLALSLHNMIRKYSRKKTAIRKKYSHEPYMAVARIVDKVPVGNESSSFIHSYR